MTKQRGRVSPNQRGMIRSFIFVEGGKTNNYKYAFRVSLNSANNRCTAENPEPRSGLRSRSRFTKIFHFSFTFMPPGFFSSFIAYLKSRREIPHSCVLIGAANPDDQRNILYIRVFLWYTHEDGERSVYRKALDLRFEGWRRT